MKTRAYSLTDKTPWSSTEQKSRRAKSSSYPRGAPYEVYGGLQGRQELYGAMTDPGEAGGKGEECLGETWGWSSLKEWILQQQTQLRSR